MLPPWRIAFSKQLVCLCRQILHNPAKQRSSAERRLVRLTAAPYWSTGVARQAAHSGAARRWRNRHVRCAVQHHENEADRWFAKTLRPRFNGCCSPQYFEQVITLIKRDDERQQVQAQRRQPQQRNRRHVLADMIRGRQQHHRRQGRKDDPQCILPPRHRLFFAQRGRSQCSLIYAKAYPPQRAT